MQHHGTRASAPASSPPPPTTAPHASSRGRYLIQLLPAAVVAPLFFRGEIEFGVINQSQSAFNHILNDVSLVVYQFDALAGGWGGGAVWAGLWCTCWEPRRCSGGTRLQHAPAERACTHMQKAPYLLIASRGNG
jgi:hypothetical protein